MRKIYVSELVTTPEKADVHITVTAHAFTARVKPGDHVMGDEYQQIRTFDFNPEQIKEESYNIKELLLDKVSNIVFIS